MKLPRKPATLLKRITEDLAVIRNKVSDDESLLRGMLRILTTEGKREADQLGRRMERVTEHIDALAAMVPGGGKRVHFPEPPTPRALEAQATALYEAATERAARR